MFNFDGMFNGMFKPVGENCCRMGMNGEIAIKTSGGYKTYNLKKNKLVNCSNFVLDVGNMFWVVPTFKVERGDIILVNGHPRCVIEVNSNSIKAFSYEDSTIIELVPERHVFMGKTYCYGKIFSPFMNMNKSDGAMSSMMKLVMMNRMFGNGNSNDINNMGINPMMFMMMNGFNGSIFEDMFDGAFDFGEKEEDKEGEKEE